MSWVCPHCGTTATLQASNIKTDEHPVLIETAKDDEGIVLQWFAVKCPSKVCGKFVLDVNAYYGSIDLYQGTRRIGTVSKHPKRLLGIGHFRFEPRVGAPLSAYVPRQWLKITMRLVLSKT